MRREKLFWNLMANHYSKNPVKDTDAYDKTLDDTKKYLKSDMHVLELGCGTSSTAIHLASSVEKYTASDISGKMVELGRKKVEAKGFKNIDNVEADPLDEKLTENTFDAVLAYNVLHLVKDRDEVMKRVNKLLKPGGIFISKTVCMGESKLMPIIGVIMSPFIGPLKSFSVEQYRASVENAGFEIVEELVYDEEPPRMFVVGKKK